MVAAQLGANADLVVRFLERRRQDVGREGQTALVVDGLAGGVPVATVGVIRAGRDDVLTGLMTVAVVSAAFTNGVFTDRGLNERIGRRPGGMTNRHLAWWAGRRRRHRHRRDTNGPGEQRPDDGDAQPRRTMRSPRWLVHIFLQCSGDETHLPPENPGPRRRGATGGACHRTYPSVATTQTVSTHQPPTVGPHRLASAPECPDGAPERRRASPAQNHPGKGGSGPSRGAEAPSPPPSCGKRPPGAAETAGGERNGRTDQVAERFHLVGARPSRRFATPRLGRTPRGVHGGP
jgi:hypothetical protein